ncbi:hypothetical protein PG990_012086 [Apiospora arundinis]
MRCRIGQRPEHLPAEINIYGAKANAREIGGTLSKFGIFLQRPKYGLGTATEYHNPHILRMDGYPDLDPSEELQEPTNGFHETTDISLGESTRRNDNAMVDSILDSLSHHPILQNIDIVPEIKTPLLDHQKEAFDFVYRRETEQMDTDLSLWKYNDIDADEPFYQHVLSGAKQPKPAEARGGIIGDEMGLGKSLVIISTIAGSLGRAEKFVAAESQHRLYQPGRKVASKGTLIIVPSTLLIDNWVDELRKHTHSGALPFHKHIGPGRHDETHYLCDRQIIFTTYATVAAEFRNGVSTLAKINWFRIVLDEAHDIRNRLTKQFQAVTSLSASHRWCLTGTPIQNDLDDLGALVSFLKVPVLEKAPTFRKLITNPITKTSNSGSITRFKNLRVLLRAICLRRTRQLLHLPEPRSYERKLDLTPSEYSDYQDLIAQAKTDIDMAVSRRGKSNSKSAVLESLLKLRLFCNNGRTNAVIQSGPTGLPTNSDVALTYLQEHEQNVCAYCSRVVYFISENAANDGGIFISGCSHLRCHDCALYHRANRERCPSCDVQDGSVTQTTLVSSDRHIETFPNDNNLDTGLTGPFPSKLQALLSDIQKNSTHKRLNLAVASRIYLLEPQWNPSIESQAIGRALRIGQTAQVVIIRYIMKKTIEENDVLFSQERKLELAGGGFNKGKDDRIQELRNVFSVDENLAPG